MNLSKLATKPQLVKLSIDDQETLDNYGEALDFWVLDRLPIDQYMKFTTVDETHIDQMFDLAMGLILDENGDVIVTRDNQLPMDLMIKAVNLIVDHLGNSTKKPIGKI